MTAPSESSTLQPTTLEEIAAAVRVAEGPLFFGAGRSLELPGTRLDLTAYQGVISFEPADQVAVVRAGTEVGALNAALAGQGQCLPLRLPFATEAGDPTATSVGEALAWNLPHTLEAQCGTWRDWVLGLTLVLADGTVAHCGSKAVKNVAGYDVQKLLIGARDSLAVVVEVILRTYPLRALPEPDIQPGTAEPNAPTWIQRVLPTDFDVALANAGDRLILADRATATLWCAVEPDRDLTRFAHDWVVRIGRGATDVGITDPTELRLMRRAKELLDPRGKLNPGIWGFL